MTKLDIFRKLITEDDAAEILYNEFGGNRFSEIINNEICDIPISKDLSDEEIEKHCGNKDCKDCIVKWLRKEA